MVEVAPFIKALPQTRSYGSAGLQMLGSAQDTPLHRALLSGGCVPVLVILHRLGEGLHPAHAPAGPQEARDGG